MTVKEIVKTYLEQYGYDGLYQHSDCGCCDCCCKIDDLFTCGECLTECEAGYFIDRDCDHEDHDFHIGPKSKNIKASGGLDETVVDCVSDDDDRYNRLDVDWDRMEHVVHDIVPYLGSADIKGNARALLQLKAWVDEVYRMMEDHAVNVHGDWDKNRLDWLEKRSGLDYASWAEKRAEDEGLIPKEESDG